MSFPLVKRAHVPVSLYKFCQKKTQHKNLPESRILQLYTLQGLFMPGMKD